MSYFLLFSLLLSAISCHEVQQGCRSSDDDGYCDSDSPLPPFLLDTLFPSRSLDEVWEVQPLLSTVYQDPSGAGGLAPIPTIVVPDESNTDASRAEHRHRKRFAHLLSLFSVTDIESVLSQPGISHKDDFLVVKKVVRNKEEWMGQLPQKDVPIEEARRAFELGGFSLVINAMQRRWRPIADLTRQIRKDTGTNYVSLNLYLTPDTFDRTGGRAPVETDEYGHVAKRNAFEYHWDWMDVIVLQISGFKLWSVSRAPTEYLSPRDMKRKPTLDEVEHYLSPVNETTADMTDRGRYDDFLLRPGDALYIPRGYIHNASTVSPAIASGYGGGIDAGSQEELSSMLSGPSLHLTVGIEAKFEATYEALVHHTLYAWSKRHNELRVSAPDCGTHFGVKWETVLHFAVGDVARRQCGWGREDGCILRRSVPRGAIWEDRVAKQVREDDRKEMLLKAIRNIQQHANAEGAGNMAANVVQKKGADEDKDNFYYIPIDDANNMPEIACIARGLNMLEGEDMKQHWKGIYQFAGEHFDVVLSQFEEQLEASWESDIQKDDVDLFKVGQF